MSGIRAQVESIQSPLSSCCQREAAIGGQRTVGLMTGMQVEDLVKGLEKSQGGNQVKNLKVGLLGGLSSVMKNKKGDTENS